MAVTALQPSSGLNTAGGAAQRTDRGVGALKSEDFFRILITELRQQDPLQPAKFKVNHLGFYAGDQWRLHPRWTVTFGTRVDITRFPDKPTANPVAVENFGYATDVVPENTQWSPRVGFNWDRKGTGREQIRGGIGLFAGRTPYVWISNQYGNTGIEFRRLSLGFNVNNRIPFVPDPAAQPTSVGNAATNEVDMIDPDYKYPSLVRFNAAYDRDLGFFGFIGTAEFLYSQNLNDVRYENLNLRQVSTRASSGQTPLTSTRAIPGRSQSEKGVPSRYSNGIIVSGCVAM